MASLGAYLPSPGKVAWRLDAAQEDVTEGNKVRHVMIRSAEVWEYPTPYVMYKVEVMTENDQWYLFRRYSQFYTLHRRLMKLHGVSRDLLPPKRYHGNLSKRLIDQRRLQLEGYLQKLIHSEAGVSQSDELFQFLDVPSHDIVKVTDILTRHLYHHGDKLLMQAKPVALSVNEMYSITKRLRLPLDATGVDTSDPASDPSNLYSFLHQLQSLRVCLPPPPTSVCCMPFDLSHFRSLRSLKLDRVQLSQTLGLLSLQQQITKLTVTRSLRTIRELLIESVEERRSGGSPVMRGGRGGSGVEQWRVTAMAKLTENRVVVQPWHSLRILVLSHNKITHLDDSLQILPVLTELNLSHNLIQVLEVSFLCIPTLEKLNLAHNAISKIIDGKKVLETVISLNLSHNRLHSLDGILSFVSVASLNLNYNLVGTKKDLNRLMQLRKLKTLCLQGNPVSTAPSSRLLLLAKFMHKSRDIQLDGQEAMEKELIKIHSYRDRYGNDPDDWPITQSVVTQPDSSSGGDTTTTDESESCDGDTSTRTHPSRSGRSLPTVTGTVDRTGGKDAKNVKECGELDCSTCLDTEPPMEISWQVHAPGDHRGFPISRLSDTSQCPADRRGSMESSVLSSEAFILSSSYLTTQLHQGRNTFPDESSEEGYAVGSLRSDPSLLTTAREEPDGRSERSEVTPPTGLPGTSDPPSLSTKAPPTTPQMVNGNYKPHVSPAMIQSALEALQRIEDKQRLLMPRESATDVTATAPILSEAVTSALTAWISHQNSNSVNTTPLISPPPSTPLEASTELPCRAISASELIAALSSLIPSTPAAAPSSLSLQDSSKKTQYSTRAYSSSSLQDPPKKSPGTVERVDDVAGKRSQDLSLSSGEGKCGGELQGTRIVTSRENSNPGSFHTTTPQEGLEEWYKLGIRPEDVINALSALTIQDPQRTKNEEQCATLSPITEERPSFNNRFSDTVTSEGTTQVSSREIGVDGEGRGPGESGKLGEAGERGEVGKFGEVGECGESAEICECGEEGGENGEDGDSGGIGERGEISEGGRSGLVTMLTEEDTENTSLTRDHLSWDSADITEIRIGGGRSTGDFEVRSENYTATSLEAEVDSISSHNMTDSENPVFSPETSYPTSPLMAASRTLPQKPTVVDATLSVSEHEVSQQTVLHTGNDTESDRFNLNSNVNVGGDGEGTVPSQCHPQETRTGGGLLQKPDFFGQL